MKKILFMAICLLSSMAVFAQNYQKAYVGFETCKFKDADNSQKGFNLGYAYGLNLGQQPMYLEFGGEFDFLASSEDLAVIETKTKLMSLQIPVNFGYRVAINDNMAIMPYVGQGIRINIKAETENTYSALGEEVTETINWFDGDAKRFQLLLNVGLNFDITKNLGIGYRLQASEIKIADEMNEMRHNLTVSFKF